MGEENRHGWSTSVAIRDEVDKWRPVVAQRFNIEIGQEARVALNVLSQNDHIRFH